MEKVTLDNLRKLGLGIEHRIEDIYEIRKFKNVSKLELTPENFTDTLDSIVESEKVEYTDSHHIYQLVDLESSEVLYETIEIDWFFSCLKNTIENQSFTEPTTYGIWNKKEESFESFYSSIDSEELKAHFVDYWKVILSYDIFDDNEKTEIAIGHLKFTRSELDKMSDDQFLELCGFEIREVT